MRTCSMLAALLCLAGCDVQREGGGERAPLSPPGIATADDVSAVEDAAQGATSRIPGATSNPPPQSASAQPDKGIIGKTTAQIVDANKAKQNPKIVEVENKISVSDPLTTAASAYISITSRASTLGFQQALQHYKALNGKNPTYDEFMQMVKQNRVEFAMLPPYQMYGYDEKTGGIVILEDKADKIRRYKEKDIPLDPEDKQYE